MSKQVYTPEDTDELRATIGARAKLSRASSKLTQVQAGRRIGITAEFYARVERGHALPGVGTLKRMADVFDVSVEVARLEEELAEARAKAEAATRESRTVGELIEDYVAYLRDHKQRAASTVQTTRFQLNGLLAPVAHMAARAITAQRAEALYRRRAAECAAATHHAGLKQTRTLWRWAAKKKLVRSDIWKEIEPIDTTNEGKEQLHPTAAKLIFRHALARAMAGKPAVSASATSTTEPPRFSSCWCLACDPAKSSSSSRAS